MLNPQTCADILNEHAPAGRAAYSPAEAQRLRDALYQVTHAQLAGDVPADAAPAACDADVQHESPSCDAH